MKPRGFTLVELLVSMALAVVLLASLATTGRIIGVTAEQDAAATGREGELDFALRRIRLAVADSSRLMLPLHDRSSTPYPENLREQSVPAVPPGLGLPVPSAVLAVALGRTSDLDFDGIPDADNDGDGRINEDWPRDSTNDAAAGVVLVDDDADGVVDEGSFGANHDDDEWLLLSEDPVNGVDDDNDGSIDEDATADMNGDGEPGLAGFDDDGDGAIDEGDNDDDDEDGFIDEDWLDPHVFYLVGSDLVERLPVPWDANGDSLLTGLDYVETVIASNVAYFGVHLLTDAYQPKQLLEISLTLASPNAPQVHRVIRVAL